MMYGVVKSAEPGGRGRLILRDIRTIGEAKRKALHHSRRDGDFYTVVDQDGLDMAIYHEGEPRRALLTQGDPRRRPVKRQRSSVPTSAKRFKTDGGWGVYDLTYRTMQVVYSSKVKAERVLRNFRKMNPDRRFMLKKVATKMGGWKEASSTQLHRVLKKGTPAERAIAKKELARRRRSYSRGSGGWGSVVARFGRYEDWID